MKRSDWKCIKDGSLWRFFELVMEGYSRAEAQEESGFKLRQHLSEWIHMDANMNAAFVSASYVHSLETLAEELDCALQRDMAVLARKIAEEYFAKFVEGREVASAFYPRTGGNYAGASYYR